MTIGHWRIVEQEEQVEIFNDAGKSVASFAVSENLPRALALLREFNRAKDGRGEPIYNYFLYGKISPWSFQQMIIFDHYFRYFAKYEMVHRFFCDQSGSVTVEAKQVSDELKRVLGAISGLKVLGPRPRTIFNKLAAGGLKFLALVITWLAIGKLIFKKNLPVVYSPDRYSDTGCDFRIYPLYKYLRDKRQDYVEVFHTSWGKNFIINLIKRRRLAIYLESLVWHPNKLIAPRADFSFVPGHVEKFFNYMLAETVKRIAVSLQLITRLEKILSVSSIMKIVALDDVRYTNELIVAGRQNKIKIYGLQHGQFTKYHVGWMNYDFPPERSITFDKLFVWNDYWKKILLTYSSQYINQNVVVGGWLRKLPDFTAETKTPAADNLDNLIILIPYEIFLSRNAMQKYIRKFLALGITIYFKIRPDLSLAKQWQDYGFLPGDNVVAVKKIDAEILGRVAAIAGVYSTFLSEMIYYEKPILLLDCAIDLGHYLKDDNLAVPLSADFSRQEIVAAVASFRSLKSVVWPPTRDVSLLFKELIP